MPQLRERYSLARFQQRFATEDACLNHLEQARWPYGPVCPRCGVIGESSRLTARPRVRQCAACHKQFSVTAHTPLHKTHLPLSVWFTALYLLAQSRSPAIRGLLTHTFWVIPAFSSGRPRGAYATQTMGQQQRPQKDRRKMVLLLRLLT